VQEILYYIDVINVRKKIKNAFFYKKKSIKNKTFLNVNKTDTLFFTARCTIHCAKRGLAIACRPSVCPSVRPSVTLVICDHIGLKSWKLTARTISQTHSLFVAKRRSTYSQGNMEKFWGDCGVGKKCMLENKSGNISETRKDRGKVTMDDL